MLGLAVWAKLLTAAKRVKSKKRALIAGSVSTFDITILLRGLCDIVFI
jgi:hypothetical protein